MLNGPIEGYGREDRCLLCGLNGPDNEHLRVVHNAQQCIELAPRSYASPRRGVLVTHLIRQHGVRDVATGQVVADKMKSSIKKQAWSCGFCVAHFSALEDRLGHISAEHLGKSAKFEDFSITNVVKGLLRQPALLMAWERLMDRHYPLAWPDITWDNSNIGDLQRKLEEGPLSHHGADALVQDAFKVGRIDHGSVLLASPEVPDLDLDGSDLRQPAVS